MSMKASLRASRTASFGLATCLLAAFAGAEDDAEGCKDHPLLNRMPGYRINACEVKTFDARDFPAVPGVNAENNALKVISIEGKQTYIQYDRPEETGRASGLQIQRNFTNAVRAKGGQVIGEYGGETDGKGLNDEQWGVGDRAAVYKLNQGGREVWIRVHPYNGGAGYAVYIAEREAMTQSIAVNELLDAINKDGYISLQINFDTGKATIKADSFPQLDQVAGALKQQAALNLEIGGHTDNVGTAEANLTLSDARARSVMTYLTGKGVPAARLTAKGYGQTKPIADNRSEDGRAKNRRVELVKK
jgi:OOP family OmpA-OmpF porin